MYREREEREYRRRGRSRSPHRDYRPRTPPQDSRVLYSRDYNHGRGTVSDRERREDIDQPFQGRSRRPFEEYEPRRREYSYRNDTPDDMPNGPFVDFGRNDLAEDQNEEEVADHEVAAMFEDELDILEGNVVKQKVYQGMGYYCEVCKINSTSVQSLQLHFAGAKHKKNLAKKGLSDDLDDLVKLPKDETVSDTILKCVLCNVILQGSEIDVHSRAVKHKEMLSQVHVNNRYSGEMQWYEPVNTATEIEPNISISEDHFECKMCGVVLPKEEQFLLHMNGKKHQKKMRWKHISGNDPEDGGNDAAQFWCSICNIFCSDRDVLDQHFAGKRHAKMLRTKGVSENEISEGLESNVKVFPEDPVKTSVPFKIENAKPKASSGLYGSLPLVLAANKAVGSSSQGYVSTKQPITSAGRATVNNYGASLSTVKSSRTSKPPAPKNVDKVRNPISVGAFLQSIRGEDPCSKNVVNEEPQVSEFLQPKQPEGISAVSQFINKISFRLPSQQSALRSYPPVRRPANHWH